MYKHINKILVTLSYTVNCYPPLIDDEEVEDLEKILNDLENDDEPNAEDFAVSDEFIHDIDI